jgi:hypothetical protein
MLKVKTLKFAAVESQQLLDEKESVRLVDAIFRRLLLVQPLMHHQPAQKTVVSIHQ